MYLYLLIPEGQNKTQFSGKLSFVPVGVNNQKGDDNGKGQGRPRVKVSFVPRHISSVHERVQGSRWENPSREKDPTGLSRVRWAGPDTRIPFSIQPGMGRTVKESPVNINLPKVQKSKECVGNQERMPYLDLNMKKDTGRAGMIQVRAQVYRGSDETKDRSWEPAPRTSWNNAGSPVGRGGVLRADPGEVRKGWILRGLIQPVKGFTHQSQGKGHIATIESFTDLTCIKH